MSQYDGKIFGIGFYKTGTTSLFEALRLLGYDTVNGDTPGSYPGADDGATLIRRIDTGDLAAARARHAASRAELPRQATQLQRGEVCIPTRYES